MPALKILLLSSNGISYLYARGCAYIVGRNQYAENKDYGGYSKK